MLGQETWSWSRGQISGLGLGLGLACLGLTTCESQERHCLEIGTSVESTWTTSQYLEAVNDNSAPEGAEQVIERHGDAKVELFH